MLLIVARVPRGCDRLEGFLQQVEEGPGDEPELQEDADPPDEGVCAQFVDEGGGVDGQVGVVGVHFYADVTAVVEGAYQGCDTLLDGAVVPGFPGAVESEAGKEEVFSFCWGEGGTLRHIYFHVSAG